MSLINLGLVFVAGVDLGMCFLILFLNPRNKINLFISLTTFALAGWTFGMGMFRSAGIEWQAWVWTWVQNGFGSLIPVFLFFVSIYFPYKSVVLKSWQLAAIFLSLVWMFIVVLIPGFWIKSIIMNVPNNSYQMNRLGIGYFNLHFYFYLVLAYIIFYKKFIVSSGILRTQLTYFIFSTIIVAVMGSIFGAIIPLLYNNLGLYWIGPYFAVPTMLILLSFIFRTNR
jgi:hypothetical protein